MNETAQNKIKCCQKLECVIFEGADTEVNWSAITGRDDGKKIIIKALKGSKAEEFCSEYASEDNLDFIPIETINN